MPPPAPAAALIERRRAAVPEIEYPPDLPVSAHRGELMEAIRDHQVVVVAGETGSGKTTQIPKICLELGRGVEGMIGHTQPRRLAARTVAERIAEELRVPLGGPVGYAVRFNDRSRDDTLIRLMTDGLLLAEVQRDRLLRRYDTIIVDEAHERSLNIDFLLGYLHRILPQRPDLKLIITSATIDPERFARHFGAGVPVVEVSGRTYPVETRYRPLVDPEAGDDAPDRDPIDAIGDAADELLRERPGDVLVFLSGEREIRDTADALRGRLGDAVELLPLYARLSGDEQQRVFKPHGGRRIVLATNVAETSLTVPGIRYVIDPGTARISRYSSRLKVQRLPIEAISQASADQRRGRCGRVAEGICIRLFAEDDYDARPRFTDPEILRTNLASVILQMASIGLGRVEDFPFLDPPDSRQVRDGLNLLNELGAIDTRAAGGDGPRLTKLGRRLAGLPVDPRMGRMVLEAGRLHCADEVIVIAAGLSIQDPRERPADQQAQADQQHARFADPDGSDFLAYLNLWRYLREGQRELSGSQFRRRCKAEYLHYLRVREWQDLVAQLRQAAKGAGVKINREPAEPNDVHVALLSGLLSHVGLKDDRQRREYVGARGARFAIFPGSSLARKQPAWVMAAELVETSRLWGRTAARIQPGWVEPLARHLVNRSHSEPRWDARRASVVATERVTLYGLPIVAGRRVDFGGIDPVAAREIFIRAGLVERGWENTHLFFAGNGRLIEEAEELEQRTRRRDVVIDDDAMYRFYDERVPEGIVSAAHFNRWWRDERGSHPDLLTFPRSLLFGDEPDAGLDPQQWPTGWRQGALTLRLSYRFDPGAPDDGVTVHVPLTALAALRPDGFEWLVPGLRLELVTTLIRSLPKEVRRGLVPVPDVARQVLDRLRPRSEPLLPALARELEALRGVRVDPGAFDLDRLPPHLRVTYRAEDSDGVLLGLSADLYALRAELRPRLRAELADATSGLEATGLTAWTIGDLPRHVAVHGVNGYPALVDEGETAGVRVLESRAAQAEQMAAGTRRLLLLAAPGPQRYVREHLDGRAQLALAASPYPDAAAVVADATAAAVDQLVAEAGGPAWDEPGFRRLRDRVAGQLAERTLAVVGAVVGILDSSREVLGRLPELTAEPLHEARVDLAGQLSGLVYDGFVAETGAARLPDVQRYLQAMIRRLDRVSAAPEPDRDRMRVVHELEGLFAERLADWPAGRPLSPELAAAGWMLEELRVAQFAQGLGVRGPVSVKRIRRALADA